MKIRDLMERIRLHEMVLPEFQREYVWSIEQARQLLISLYREYPTGSLLFWNTVTPPAVKNHTLNELPGGEKQVILDGQQRLTALYLLTQGLAPPYYPSNEITNDPRSLYFDLATGEIHGTPSEAVPLTWMLVTECFKPNINVTIIAQQLVGSQYPAELANLLQKFLVNLNRLSNIMERDYPNQTVPITATLDDAIDVFDRVNSQGTKLTAAELALTHISSRWVEARREMKELLTELTDQSLHLNLDILVHMLVAVVNGRAKLDTIHTTSHKDLINGWHRVRSALRYLVTDVLDRAFTTASNKHTILEPLVVIVAHLARRGGRFSNQYERQQAVRWLYLACIWQRYDSEIERRLDFDLSLVRRTYEPWHDLEETIVDQRGRLDVSASDLEGRSLEHPLQMMLNVITLAHHARDWFTSMPLASAPTIRHHRLFSEDLVDGNDRKVHKHLDEIANHVLLISTSSSPLVLQLPNIVRQTPGILDAQCVPLDTQLWQPSQFITFLAERRSLLAQGINAHLGALLVDVAPPPRLSLLDLISTGESATLEFKSTYQWDIIKKEPNKELPQEVAKTIAGFMNSGGGILLIGVEDNGNIFGIEHDLKLRIEKERTHDKFELDIRQLINDRMGPEYTRYVRLHFSPQNDKTVCIIKVYPSPRAVFCTHKKDPTMAAFLVRSGNLTQALTPTEINSYISLHWQGVR